MPLSPLSPPSKRIRTDLDVQSSAPSESLSAPCPLFQPAQGHGGWDNEQWRLAGNILTQQKNFPQDRFFAIYDVEDTADNSGYRIVSAEEFHIPVPDEGFQWLLRGDNQKPALLLRHQQKGEIIVFTRWGMSVIKENSVESALNALLLAFGQKDTAQMFDLPIDDSRYAIEHNYGLPGFSPRTLDEVKARFNRYYQEYQQHADSVTSTMLVVPDGATISSNARLQDYPFFSVAADPEIAQILEGEIGEDLLSDMSNMLGDDIENILPSDTLAEIEENLGGEIGAALLSDMPNISEGDIENSLLSDLFAGIEERPGEAIENVRSSDIPGPLAEADGSVAGPSGALQTVAPRKSARKPDFLRPGSETSKEYPSDLIKYFIACYEFPARQLGKRQLDKVAYHIARLPIRADNPQMLNHIRLQLENKKQDIANMHYNKGRLSNMIAQIESELDEINEIVATNRSDYYVYFAYNPKGGWLGMSRFMAQSSGETRCARPLVYENVCRQGELEDLLSNMGMADDKDILQKEESSTVGNELAFLAARAVQLEKHHFKLGRYIATTYQLPAQRLFSAAIYHIFRLPINENNPQVLTYINAQLDEKIKKSSENLDKLIDTTKRIWTIQEVMAEKEIINQIVNEKKQGCYVQFAFTPKGEWVGLARFERQPSGETYCTKVLPYGFSVRKKELEYILSNNNLSPPYSPGFVGFEGE